MVTKDEILSAIRRQAGLNGGTPPGSALFERETGIRRHVWNGVYWAKWSDALVEAGYEPNPWNGDEGRSTGDLSSVLAGLVRRFGRWPSKAEVGLAHRADPHVPSVNTFRVRLGLKPEQVAATHEWATTNDGWSDVAEILQSELTPATRLGSVANAAAAVAGSVYLMHSGRHYKIGRSSHVGRRSYEVALQLPERLKVIHVIETDDPEGIEAYWHHRFATKRANGEWFSLTPEDVAAFRRRAYM